MKPSELERALSQGRAWSREELGRLDPTLTRRLVWGQYDRGRVLRVFRLEADGARGVDGEALALGEGPVRLVHPSELSSADRAAWGDALAALSILQPIPQLARPVYAPAETDRGGDTLRGFPRREVGAERVRRVLEGGGWEPGEPDERLRVRFFTKRFEREAVVAVLCLSPGLAPNGDGAAQTPTEAFFTHRAPGGLSVAQAPRLPLDDVPPGVLSEVLFELGGLEARDTIP